MASKMSNNRKIAIYLREVANDSVLKARLEILRDHVRTLGLHGEIVCFMDDLDGRNAFQQMMLGVRAEDYALVMCEKLESLDCVADDIERFILFVAEMERVGTRFVSVADDIDTIHFPSGGFLKITRAIDEAKASLRIERVRSSLRTAKNAGKRIGRPSGEHDKQILTLRRSGLSIRTIAAKLGISPSTVQTALRRHESDETRL